MKKKFLVALMAIMSVVALAFGLTACGSSTESREKQVPVYQGMTISDNFSRTTMASALTLYGSSDDKKPDPNPEHGNDHVHGDDENRNEDLDPEKPFDDPRVPAIEDKAESSLDVIGAGDSIYYADKNQDIYITIKLSNPDSYEILSFTLNEKKYTSYMFEEGSDLENLVLKVNVGNVAGIVDYTIDAIKYVDGTEIKDVRMDGDKTVKAGIRGEDQTYVSITNEQKSMTSISFEAQVIDLYSLVEKSGGYAKAVLYDGANMISKDLAVGEKTLITFDNLTPNTVYQYGVVALYDNLSGDGVQLNFLYTNAVYTDTIVLFKDVQVGQESISWSYDWNESIADKTMLSVTLLKNGEKVQDIDTAATSINGLLTNNEYVLTATYKNLSNNEETIQITFLTYEKATPVVVIENATATQTEIAFEIAVTDTDNVGTISKIELLHGNDEPVVAENNQVRTFANLLSNNEYTVQVTYTYDLNDGIGEQSIVKTVNVTTQAKAIPVAEIKNLTSTQTTIDFDVTYTDTDEVGSVTEVALYRNEEKIRSVPFASHITFEELNSGLEYKVVVEYSYDLNDGVGTHNVKAEKNYSTLVDSIVVDELVLLNNNVVKLGEELNLRVYFANRSEIELTSIYVNGQKATVVGGDRIESAIIKFVPNESGLCEFTIDRVDYVINGIEVNQRVESDVTVEYPIFTDINITYTPVTLSKYENTGDGTYISFANPDGYKVYKVNDSENFVTVGDGVVFTKDRGVSSIEYGYDNYGHTTQNCDYNPEYNDWWWNNYGGIHNVTSLQRIYTAEEFFAMTDGYYVLMNDLDLRKSQTGKQIALSGIFDGNGHTIRGLSNVVDTSKYDYFDLFSGGSIYDATFSELYVSVNSSTYLSVNPLGGARLYNSTVKGDVVLSSNVSYGQLNVKDNSTSYNINVTIGANLSTQKYTATTLLEKNTHIVERNGAFYFDCEVGKVLLAYVGSGATEYTVEDGTFAVRNYALSNCNLTTLVMPESVKSVGEGVFSGSSFSNLQIPTGLINQLSEEQRKQLVTLTLLDDGTTEIYGGAFYECNNLTSVTIPDGVTSIGSYAFLYCSSLTSVTIGNSITSIGNSAFEGCYNLTSVTFENTSGWWYASSSTATSGTSISATDLADPSTAATYLMSTYYSYYWKRS